MNIKGVGHKTLNPKPTPLCSFDLGIYILLVFFFFFLVAMGHLVGLSSKTLWNLPSSCENYIVSIVYIYVRYFT